MRLAPIKEGDIVMVNIKGRQFYALVRGADNSTASERALLPISPLNAGVSYYHAQAREVVGHWRRAGKTNA